MFKPKISKEEVNALPVTLFDGKITIVDEMSKVYEAITELNQQKIVGIDTETKPSFKKGMLHKVALLQVSTVDHCFLFRLNMIPFPKELGDFLSNASIRKVGLALKDDFAALNKHHTFRPDNIVDLQSIVKSYGILELGLQKIFAIVFHQKISKSQRLTNWESQVLTDQQQRYAATDAWAALIIYKALMNERKLTKKDIDLLIMQVTEASSPGLQAVDNNITQ